MDDRVEREHALAGAVALVVVTLILVLVVGTAVFFYPREYNSYRCGCLGFGGRPTAFELTTDVCFGIPRCGE